MLKLKLTVILLISIAVLKPSLSQQLYLTNNLHYVQDTTKKIIIEDDSNQKSKAKEYRLKNEKTFEVITNIGLGTSTQYFIGFTSGVTLGFADLVDIRAAFDSYTTIDMGGGSGKQFSALFFSGNLAHYFPKKILKTSVGIGLGVRTGNFHEIYYNSETASRLFVFLDLKLDVFFSKFFGIGLETKFFQNPGFNSNPGHGTYNLNFNFRLADTKIKL